MREILKKSYFGVGEFFKTLVSLMSVLFFSSRKAERSIKGLNSCEGKSVSVLANGPSFKEIQDNKLNLLDGTDVVMMNHSANSEVFSKLKPKYYILLDPGFFSKEHVEDENSPVHKTFVKLKSVVWPMIIFLPSSCKVTNEIQRMIGNKNISIVQYNSTTILGFKSFRNRMLRANKGIPSSNNVLIPAIQLMISLHYSNVYIYGADFSWTKLIDVDPKNNKVFRNDIHFYEEKDMNTITYYDKGWFLWSLYGLISSIEAMNALQDFAEFMKVRVINRTKGSFIDSFPYENIDNIDR